MHRSQRGSQTGILHTYFYTERHAFWALQTQQATDKIADAKSEEVMEHHYEHDEQTCGQKTVGVMRHDDADSKSHRERRERRQVRSDALREFGDETLA